MEEGRPPFRHHLRYAPIVHFSAAGLFFHARLRDSAVWLIADLIRPSFVSTESRFSATAASVSNRLFTLRAPSHPLPPEFPGGLSAFLLFFPFVFLLLPSSRAVNRFWRLQERETFRGRNLRNARALRG